MKSVNEIESELIKNEKVYGRLANSIVEEAYLRDRKHKGLSNNDITHTNRMVAEFLSQTDNHRLAKLIAEGGVLDEERVYALLEKRRPGGSAAR